MPRKAAACVTAKPHSPIPARQMCIRDRAPAEWEPAEWEKLVGFFVAEPLWTIDLASLDGFYALAPADANGTASGCAAPDSGLSVYSDGSVTLCFTEEAPGGPEILLHIHVQSGDAAYLGAVSYTHLHFAEPWQQCKRDWCICFL